MLWEFCIAAIFERKDKMVSRVYMHTTCFPFLSVHRGKKVSFSYLTESKRLVSPSTSCTEIPHGKKNSKASYRVASQEATACGSMRCSPICLSCQQFSCHTEEVYCTLLNS